MPRWSPLLALGVLAGCGGPGPSGAVVLLPSAPRTSDVVEAIVVASDPSGSALTYRYAWTVDGQGVQHPGPSLDGDLFFDRDQVVAVTVTVVTADGDEATLRSNEVTVGNTPPTVPQVRVEAPQAQLDDDLVCVIDVPSTDADGDAISYSGSWTVDGAPVSNPSETAFPGDTVGAVASLDGQIWRCGVVANDGTDSSDTAVGVASLAPTALSVSVSPQPLLTAAMASASSSVPAPPGGGFAYAWTVDGSAAGGSEPTLDGVTWFERGDEVAVTLTVLDRFGNASSVDSDPVTVANTPPPAPTLTLTPGVVQQLDGDLVCEVDVPATDADGDPVGVTIWWEVDGVPYIDALTTVLPDDTVPVDDTVLGTTWTCFAIADDGLAVSAEASAARVLDPCACDLAGAGAALDDLDPRTAHDIFEACLRCEPGNSEALLGASLTSLLTFTDWQPVQALLTACDQNLDLAGDLYGQDGYLYAFDALAAGDTDLWLGHAFDSERPSDVDFGADPIVVSAVLDGTELVLTIADDLDQAVAKVGLTANPADYLETLGFGDSLEIVLDVDDVYGDQTLALADGVVVDLKLMPLETVAVRLGCEHPGSSCGGQFHNKELRGTVTFTTWSGVVDGAVEAEMDFSVGAYCAWEPCNERHFVVGSVTDTLSAPLDHPDIPFGDLPRPALEYRPRSAELYDLHCDIPTWGTFNDLHAAMADRLALEAARMAAAGLDAGLSLEVPTTHLVASCDEALWFNQADASTLAAAAHAGGTAFALMSQYNVHEPTGDPIDSIDDYDGEVDTCVGGTCSCEITSLRGRRAIDRLADLDVYFLTASPVFDYATVEYAALEALATTSQALDALPVGDGWLNFGGYGGMQDLRLDALADLDAAQASRSAPVPLASAPAFVATLGEFLDTQRTRDEVLIEIGAPSLLEIEPGFCLDDGVLGPHPELAAWLENDGAGAMIIPLNDAGAVCGVDADCDAGFACDKGTCEPWWPTWADVDELRSAIGGDGFPVFASRSQLDSVTCPFGGWDGFEP